MTKIVLEMKAFKVKAVVFASTSQHHFALVPHSRLLLSLQSTVIKEQQHFISPDGFHTSRAKGSRWAFQ